MIRAGLVSISFRKLTPSQIVDLVAHSRLQGIEWGGDVHVPHGDRARAAEVATMTRNAGLTVAVYGSYYRAGEPVGPDNPDFGAVLESAVLLGAPAIRVWCGRQPSAVADETYRSRVTADLQRIGQLAAAHGIVVTCEHHGHTLTDARASALRLYADLRLANVQPNWQPSPELSQRENLDVLLDLRPRLVNVHVFHWVVTAGRRERCPLSAGRDDWASYLQALRATGRAHWALLEFVKDDRPEQMIEDAATLADWLAAHPA